MAAPDPFELLCARAARAAVAGFDAFAGEAGALQALARSDLVARRVEEHVARLARDPTHWREMPAASTLHLAEADDASLVLVLVAPEDLEREADRVHEVEEDEDDAADREGAGLLLHGAARHVLVAPVTGAVAFELYRQDGGRPDVFERGARLARAPEGRATLRPGDVRALEAFRDVRGSVVTAGAAPAVLLELCSPAVHQQFWTYARDSLVAIESVSADFRNNRIEHALALLVELGAGRDAAEAAAAVFASHPAHHVRWSAVRAAMELDEATGAALLDRATRDPHPHVARVAARCAAQLATEGDE